MQSNQQGKGRAFALTAVASATLISLVICVCFTATRFIGSQNDLLLDVEAPSFNLKVRVNNGEQPAE